MNILKGLFRRGNRQKNSRFRTSFSPLDSYQSQSGRTKFSRSAKENSERLRELAGGIDQDIRTRPFTMGTNPPLEGIVCYLKYMVSSMAITDELLKPLMISARNAGTEVKSLQGKDLIDKLMANLILSGQPEELIYEDEALAGIMSGKAILFIDGFDTAISIDVGDVPKRPIQEPQTESVIRGPREGFTENLENNKALLRKRINTGLLRMESFRVGRISKTDGFIAYIEGITDPELVNEAKKRISSLDVDIIPDSSILERYIEDFSFFIFPTIYSTERPDNVQVYLNQGRVVVMIDNSPTALILPANFWDFFTTAEDRYARWPYPSFIRLVRIFAGLFAIWLPALYIALTTFHREMIPTSLVLSIAAARENVPFPAFIEAFLMEIVLELIREAGIRLPSPIGQTIGIVGAVILGQAAVSAQIVSPLLVIVVSITAISSFVVPLFTVERGVRLLRFPGMILGTTFGLYGVMAGIAAVTAAQVSITSFGKPYMAPLSPFEFRSVIDTILKRPVWSDYIRPGWLQPMDDISKEENVRAKTMGKNNRRNKERDSRRGSRRGGGAGSQ